MSDFTPTTEQVRTFWWMRGTASPGAFVSERQAQFDRWLTAHDREVAERTLLEAADAVPGIGTNPETCTIVFDPWDVDEFLRARIPE